MKKELRDTREKKTTTIIFSQFHFLFFVKYLSQCDYETTTVEYSVSLPVVVVVIMFFFLLEFERNVNDDRREQSDIRRFLACTIFILNGSFRAHVLQI